MHRAFASEDQTPTSTGQAGAVRPGSVWHSTVPAALRSLGTIDLGFELRGQETFARRAYQAGSLRLRIPRPVGDEAPCAVLINTAGGVAEGDRLDQRITWGEGTRATIATQAAEKVYRALSKGAEIMTTLDVARGATAEWLPQETILFDRFRLRRETKILLAEDVSFLGVEALVLGRQAMDETVRQGALRDRMRIWREGRLIYADTLTLEGQITELMARSAIGAQARAMAVLVHAAAGAPALLDPVRAALERLRGLGAASSWNGLLAVRLLAPDGETLRHDIALALDVLRNGRPVPRVWRC